MKISCNILKKHIKNSNDIDWVSVWDKFTIRTAEVEGIEIKGANVDGLVVAEIKECIPHPDSKKLHILQVDVGEKELVQIVCGAPNARAGIKSCLVRVGGHIDGMEITPRPLAGTMSNGMMCSGREVGISDDHEGIMELPLNLANGTNIKEVLPIEDIIVEIDNKSLTNRPDLWGHYGIAREIAAITNHELLPLDLLEIKNDKKDLDIKIKNPELCYRYIGLRMDNIENNITPMWMQIFLYYAGMRSISLLVDLTNYVMLELGTPMHAFDSRIVKNIEVGLAKDGDEFTTLDGTVRKLNKNNLMIKNGNEYFAIAGVMGGLDSEIVEDTKSVVLESACFEASSVRKTATSLGLRTEASARYEKSLDPNMCALATKRFAKLLRDENPNMSMGSNMTDVYPNKLDELEVQLDKSLLYKYMGFEIDDKKVVSILESLSFKIKSMDKDKFIVIVPTYRATKDVTMGADLIEEIARMYGYENFEKVPLSLDLKFGNPEVTFETEYDVKKYLATKYDLHEVNTYLWNKTSFMKELNIDKENVKLVEDKDDNILRDDLSLSLLDVAKTNLKNFQTFGVFEIGTVIENKENKRHLAVLSVNNDEDLKNTYYAMKSIVSNLFMTFKNAKVEYKLSNTFDYYNNDLTMDIIVNDDKLGFIKVFNKKTSNVINKKKCFVAAEIDFDKFIVLTKTEILAKEVSKYPVVQLDYSVIAPKEMLYENIDNILGKFSNNIINEKTLINVYDKGDEKTYTIRYVVGADDHTLDGNELAEFKSKFIDHIKKNGLTIVE